MVTDKQIIEAIIQLNAEKGYPPTVRELGSKVGLSSSSSIYTRLYRLKERGAVKWEKGQPRTLRVIENIEEI